MKKRFLVYLLLLTLLLPLAAHAQGSIFSVWLYEQATGTATRVAQDGGILDTFVLPSEVGYTYSRNVAVSDDGNLFAYVVSDGVSPFNGYLYIYDRAADTVRYAFDMGPTPTHSLDFSANNLNFSADNSTFAFGYANSDQSRWWALTVDLNIYDVIGGIRSTDPLAAATELPGQFLLPVVQYNRDGLVVFTPVYLGTEGLPEYDAYTWDVAAITLAPNPVYRTLNNDTFLPTGEVVTALDDARLPVDTTGAFIFYQANTLQVYDPTIAARYPFYADANTSFYSVRFVQGGERLLVGGGGIDGGNVWQLVERSGALVGFVPVANVVSSAGVLDGFIYTSNDLDSERRPQLLFINTRDGLDTTETGVPVWTGAVRESVVSIIWRSDISAVSGAAFPAWAQLAAPVNPLDAVASDSTGVSEPVLTVGGQAVINTSSGDVLNVRSGAGTTFAIVTPLNAGTLVTILEGPVDANGFRWWRIRTDTGIEGWVIESIDDNGSRLQTLVPR